MKVKLRKNLAYGRQGEVVDLSDSAAIYLMRVGAAESVPKKKKRKTKKDDADDNRSEELS